MRLSPMVVLACAAASLAAAASSVLADNSMMSSSASMPKSHMYLLGSWKCVVSVAAMEGQPAATYHPSMTTSMAPGMTIHSHLGDEGYSADTYQGYDPKTKSHWLDSADTQGNVTLETSTDGRVFSGTSWQGTTATATRDTQTKISDTKIRDVSDVKMNGKWVRSADTVCTKG